MTVVYTIGHSTRTLEEFVGLLNYNQVKLLVDVRTIPASRRMPHFAKPALEVSMPQNSIGYLHMPELGGLRRAVPESINVGWRDLALRGYADYMQEDAFWRALEDLGVMAAQQQTAIMCAEALPRRCHRSLTSDALTVRGVEVRHIITGESEPSLHALTPFARVDESRISYPGPDTLAL